ncbi:AI-2E family transporter [Moorellaceae bacterium AZ2]
MFPLQRGKLWRLALGGTLLAGALFFLYLVRKLFIPLLMAALLAYFLKPAVTALEKRGWSRGTAILLLYFLGLGVLVLTLLYVLPRLLRELNKFLDQLPAFTGEVEGWLQYFYNRYQRPGIPAGLQRLVDETLAFLQERIEKGIRQAAGLLTGLFSGVTSLILAPVLTYYILKDSEGLSRGALRLLPAAWREDLLGLWTEIDRILTGFVRGHLLISLLVGLLTGLGLFLAGSQYAVVMGIVMGLADLIPYFGPLIGAVPIIALSWMESPRLAIYAVVVIVVVQQIETAVLAPRILGQSVELPPLAVILAILAGGELFGVVGLLLAVPAVAVGRVIVGFLWSRLVSH